MTNWLLSLFMAGSISVVDGDTVRVHDKPVRLQGYDAPEIRGKCYHERTLAYKAKHRIEWYVHEGAKLKLNRGTCGYGRACGTLTFEGKDVGELLIAEGLAAPMVCTGDVCPHKRNWCDDAR
jgi:endonuclease YncB( thermonuclease family)